MRPNPRPQEMYRHFKGNIYQIRCLARHSETGEMMVVYQAMYDTFQIYVRPLAMFMEEVDHIKYPDIRQRYRFELVQDMEMSQPVQPQIHEEPDQPDQPELAVSKEISVQEDAQAQKEPFDRQEIPVQADAAEQSKVAEQTTESEEQVYIDPLVLEFLDANTYEQRLNILAALRNRITDEMINTMAVAVDLEIKDGNVEERYEELRNCLLTFEKYECNRLR